MERKVDDDSVKKCTKVEVVGKVGRGRGRKTWLQCVNSDMKDLGLKVGEAQDRQLWRRKIFGETSEPCVHGKQKLNIDDDELRKSWVKDKLSVSQVKRVVIDIKNDKKSLV